MHGQNHFKHIDCLEFPTPTGSEQALFSLSDFHSCNWPNSLKFPL